MTAVASFYALSISGQQSLTLNLDWRMRSLSDDLL
jgi:hypothetical protein